MPVRSGRYHHGQKVMKNSGIVLVEMITQQKHNTKRCSKKSRRRQSYCCYENAGSTWAALQACRLCSRSWTQPTFGRPEKRSCCIVAAMCHKACKHCVQGTPYCQGSSRQQPPTYIAHATSSLKTAPSTDLFAPWCNTHISSGWRM